MKTILKYFLLLTIPSVCFSGYIAPSNFPLLLSSEGVTVFKETNKKVTVTIKKINTQIQDLTLSPAKKNAVDILRVEVENKSNDVFFFDLNEYQWIDCLSTKQALNIMGSSHSYVRDFFLYLTFSSIVSLYVGNSLNNSGVSAILGIANIPTSTIRDILIILAFIPPVAKTLSNIYSHAKETDFFNTSSKHAFDVHSYDRQVSLVFVKHQCY